ncbi:hypothetical protein RJ639_038523 [Escallonia herrerae]|uniref:RING-type E3 ubiquitin transferase n=1 Tax=Escallonia herrerae TaxID=1293975 RepID=A0AA88X064_9ASTE|nr:hypothetical protein RJ639_038523 [Escallonia herrerae]
MQNIIYSWHLRHSPSGTPINPATAGDQNPGLDPSIIQSFPTFEYSTVKDLRREKYGLECAICLCEFDDNDVLRLLTSCCHVFHQECIDLWLESHRSCPVCRRSLDAPETWQEKSPASANNNAMHGISENESLEDTFSITIKDDTFDDERGGSFNGAAARGGASTEENVEGHKKAEKFPRSHSTGHSIVRATKHQGREEEREDRFTLRLPEHVKAKIITGHNLTRSCTTFGEYKSKTSTGNGGFGEVSGLSGGDVNKV